jgi:hypothetical protein
MIINVGTGANIVIGRRRRRRRWGRNYLDGGASSSALVQATDPNVCVVLGGSFVHDYAAFPWRFYLVIRGHSLYIFLCVQGRISDHWEAVLMSSLE